MFDVTSRLMDIMNEFNHVQINRLQNEETSDLNIKEAEQLWGVQTF